MIGRQSKNDGSTRDCQLPVFAEPKKGRNKEIECADF
jgi:hypothetical protein